MKEDIPMVFLWEGNMSVVRVRSVVLIREGIEGRKEGRRDSPHICAFRPVHSAAFDTPSFIVARPFFNSIHFLSFSLVSSFPFPFSKTNTGTEAEDHLFQHTGTGRRHAHNNGRPASTRFYPSVMYSSMGGRENWEGGSVHIVFIHHQHRQSKQSKERRKIGRRRRRRKRRRGEKPRT